MKFKAVLFSLSALSTVFLNAGCSSAFSIGEEEFSCPGREHGTLCKGPREVYEMTNNKDEIVMYKSDEEDSDYDEHDYEHDHTDAWLIKNFDKIEAEALDDPDDDTIGLYRAAVKAKLNNMKASATDGFTEQTIYKERSTNRQHPENYDKAEVVANSIVEGASADMVSNAGNIIKTQGEHGELSLFNTAPHDIAPEPLALLKPAQVMRILVTAYKDDNQDLHMPGYVYVDLQPRSWVIGEQANSTPQRIIPLDIRNKTQRQMVEEQRRGRGVTGLGVGQMPNPARLAEQAAFSPQRQDGSQ